MPVSSEPLTEHNLGEVVRFFRDANPFAQLTWGWDTGRFVDWRWGTSAAALASGWFAEHCTVFRDGAEIRAVSVAEYGGDDLCVITGSEDEATVREVLAWLLEHRDQSRFECSQDAEWLRAVFAECGFTEADVSGCEWEFDLHEQPEPAPVPHGFAIQSLAGEATPDYAGISACIRGAFGSERDHEPGLRNLELNPLFRPELSVVVRSPDGRIAAYCRGTADPQTGVAGIDPVCCHPDFQRMGLSKALVRTCFRAQREVAGRYCYIGSAPEPAPGTFLYRSLGPSRVITQSAWSLTPAQSGS